MTVRNDHDSLSIDETTRRVTAFYRDLMTILQDPDRGLLRTAFNMMNLIRTANMPAMIESTLIQNGINADGWRNNPLHALQQIITATEKRGSNSAEGLKDYLRFAANCKMIVQSHERPAGASIDICPRHDIHDQHEFIKAKLIVLSHNS